MERKPIDKDKTTENPSTLPYPHHIGSIVVKPEDVGKIKTKALSAMEQQTNVQLAQIQKQVELLVQQARIIQDRKEISLKIYAATIGFEPLIGHTYHLYLKENKHYLSLIGPNEWSKSKNNTLDFLASVELLSDHTWNIIDNHHFN
jgi:hypothetical protein